MKIHTFESLALLEQNLAEQIVIQLSKEIQSNGSATILLSGGSTPIGLYRRMSKFPIAWENVTVGLVDERFVPNTSDSSNEKLINTNFRINYAANTTFIPMVTDMHNITKNIEELNARYTLFNNATVSVLGMGADGHTASLFPNDFNSEQDLKGTNPTDTLTIQTLAPAEPKIRISCTKNLLLRSKSLYLMITGKEKLMVLKQSKQNNLPIAYFTDTTEIYFTEN